VKAAIRLGINTSPEPVSNILVSLAEDGAVAGVVLLVLDHPEIAALIAAALLIAGIALVVLITKRIRRGLRRLQERRRGPPATN
jgi:DNA integrity scanning protein DisA with diadenylate cyclase activity